MYKTKDEDSDSDTPDTKQIVYDCMDKSPFYKKNEYIDPVK